MDDCIFCKIAKGDIPCQKLVEDNNFLAFLDNKPFAIGHTLVIPKIHYSWTYDVPNFGEYWVFVHKVTKIIQEKYKPLFVSYLTMGNEISHAHIHILPRYQDDHIQMLTKL